MLPSPRKRGEGSRTARQSQQVEAEISPNFAQPGGNSDLLNTRVLHLYRNSEKPIR
jgi:hypothetical protein